MSKKKTVEKKKRTRRAPDNYQQVLKAFRDASENHVAVFPVDVSHNQLCQIIAIAKRVDRVKRRMNSEFRKRLEQYRRERKYKEAIKKYKTATDEQREELGKILTELQEKYGLTEQECKDVAANWAKEAGIHSVFGLTIAEDVWGGVEKNLYGNAKKLGKKKDGSTKVLTLRAKQANRAIIIKLSKNKKLTFTINGITFGLGSIKGDLFLQDEQAAIVRCMTDDMVERRAVDHFILTGEVVPTYRPKFAEIVLEQYRGKWNIKVHVTVEGEALPKKNKFGKPRHIKEVPGEIGIDLGVQSFSAVGSNICEIKNLAERNNAALKNEQYLRRLQRHADRCLREANPQNYNEDGTIKKGKKTWNKSKEYERTQEKIRKYHRKNALNRKYAIREDVNRLREHGDAIVIEKQSVKGWQAGLFGKSIQSRCPGAFRAELSRKFSRVTEVDVMFRASQFDHESGEYVKKKLSQRKHYHSAGRASPRDGYSGFLLWCHDGDYASPDKKLCDVRFEDYYRRMMDFVAGCMARGVTVVNSGF